MLTFTLYPKLVVSPSRPVFYACAFPTTYQNSVILQPQRNPVGIRMGFDLATLFPGVDLCAIAARPPPRGQITNFENPAASLKDAIICLTAIPTFFATVFAAGRLWANIKRRSWSDGSFLSLKYFACVSEGY